jgi:hypothetical protein
MAKSANNNGKGLGPWRIDGISPEAVAAATAGARRSESDLAVWLSRVIRDTAERERQARAAPPTDKA